MSSPAYGKLLEIQELDIRLTQLSHAQQHHPLTLEIAELQGGLEGSDRELADLDARAHDLERQRKRLDDEVATTVAKRADVKAKMYDGSVSASKDLLAMQEEIEHLAERQTTLEDSELEFMEQLEEIAGERSIVVERRTPTEARLGELKSKLATALSELATEEQDVLAERAGAAELIPSDLMASYEQRKRDLGGIAVARLVGSTCDGCHLSLSAAAYDRIKKLPDDETVLCDQCGRILIR